MTITHDPEMDPRDPRDGDLDLFRGLEPGDEITFFEWPAEPLTVQARETDENVGETIRVEAEGEDSYLYVVDGHIWHYSPDYEGENNPFPVENITTA